MGIGHAQLSRWGVHQRDSLEGGAWRGPGEPRPAGVAGVRTGERRQGARGAEQAVTRWICVLRNPQYGLPVQAYSIAANGKTAAPALAFVVVFLWKVVRLAFKKNPDGGVIRLKIPPLPISFRLAIKKTVACREIVTRNTLRDWPLGVTL